MKLKFPAVLALIKGQITVALLLQTAAAILGALLGLLLVVLLVLGATTAVAILCGFSATFLGAAVAAFMLGSIVGGVLVYEIIERPEHNADRGERPSPVRGQAGWQSRNHPARPSLEAGRTVNSRLPRTSSAPVAKGR